MKREEEQEVKEMLEVKEKLEEENASHPFCHILSHMTHNEKTSLNFS